MADNEKKLARPVFVGGVTYPAGAVAGTDIPAEHVELIKNPKAWDAEAAAATGNVVTGPTQQFVQVENPLPRATAAPKAVEKVGEEADEKVDEKVDEEKAPAGAAAKAAAPKAAR